MLLELRISQLGLVDELVLRAEPGLTVLTGETGAGKSMIAGALSLLCGGKAPVDLVREGENEGWVEAVLDLTDAPDGRAAVARAGIRVGDDGVLVLRRELRREGRSRVMINGLVSSLAVLETVGPLFLTIQSQHQQLELGRRSFARDYLDRSLGLDGETVAMTGAWERWRDAVAARESALREADAAAEQADIWRYQRDELKAAHLDAEEEESLAERLTILQDTTRLREAAAAVHALLAGGENDASDLLARASGLLPSTDAPVRALDEARSSLLDAQDSAAAAAAVLERFLDAFDDDGGDLDELQQRKSLYEELKRKYGRDVPSLQSHLQVLDERLSRYDGADARLAELEAEEASARDAVVAAASALRAARRAGAGELAERAARAIRPLALPDLELAFVVEPRPDGTPSVEIDGQASRIDATGADVVRLEARTNRGEGMRAVAEVASGGERSRIHLGLSVLDRGAGESPLLLFDEIDAGLGMDAARPVGRLLRELSRNGQVICITHLPTMAVQGAAHWRAEKGARDGRTILTVKAVDGESRLDELERLLGGEDAVPEGAARRAYARDLLAEAAAGE